MYPNRSSTRLRGFDYGQSGAYFITLCILRRQPIMGRLQNGVVLLSPIGAIVREEWLQTPQIRPGMHLDEWIIMPDHFQAIVMIDDDRHRPIGGSIEEAGKSNGDVGAHRCAPGQTVTFHRPSRSIGSFIAQFKATTTRLINELNNDHGQKIWQRGYHDRIIRNEVELDHVRAYIRNNPKNG
jgi:putative transposase